MKARFLVLCVCVLACFLLSPILSKASEQKYVKKSITYLRMIFPYQVRKISDKAAFLAGFDLDSYLEKKIREAVEMPRFDYNPVNLSGDVDLKTLAKLVKNYVDEVKVERAKAEAKVDWRYKDLVVTAEDIRKIAESAYIYYPEIKRFSVDVVTLVIPEGKQRRVEVHISVGMGLKVTYWRVDFDTGEPVKVAEIYAEHDEMVKVGRADLISLPFPFSLLVPSIEFPETPLQAFIRCTEQTILWLARKIHKKTREIPDFKLFAPIESVSFRKAFAPLTKRDGAYIDSDFEVLEEIEVKRNGEVRTEKKRVGWVRMDKLADGKEELLSSFKIMSGSAEVGQVVVEYPLLGVGISPGTTYVPNKGAIAFYMLAHLSFAKTFSLNLPELYLFVGPEILISKDGGELNSSLGLSKKFYIGSIGINPKVSFVFTRFFTRVRDDGESYTGYGNSFGVKPAIGLEWFFSPRFSIFFIGGYRISSDIQAVRYEKNETTLYKSVQYSPSGSFISGGLEITIW